MGSLLLGIGDGPGQSLEKWRALNFRQFVQVKPQSELNGRHVNTIGVGLKAPCNSKGLAVCVFFLR